MKSTQQSQLSSIVEHVPEGYCHVSGSTDKESSDRIKCKSCNAGFVVLQMTLQACSESFVQSLRSWRIQQLVIGSGWCILRSFNLEAQSIPRNVIPFNLQPRNLRQKPETFGQSQIWTVMTRSTHQAVRSKEYCKTCAFTISGWVPRCHLKCRNLQQELHSGSKVHLDFLYISSILLSGLYGDYVPQVIR